ncbi:MULTISPECIES: SRPBCC domain-containing protein [unclassified Lysobacter]|uniref:SRPBCC domain-containing protein n=1 Tax=unclassified Lysobacter TaxID=2635362 RepID=UPI001BE88EEB|nr:MULTISPECIES: SRPBCC domain-containing protein [unclassified Lysobacter]MBT2748883.1 SRPBCC domain-containing protein [Lysobacter sp. ISL-42]MBT2753089.1 SRPBCC domain-containing protein [Lysobacter sp. ISL-50]MBT2777258.1 SRPBCC domain-containing protein [Lysobacter sp. ISL-54]MBT2783238.1 SRPBCC domain-containing protein [Lysobacter sp. ISL-52]
MRTTIGSITTGIIAALGLALAAGSAGAAVKDVTANGFTIENEQTVAADPATVWKALVGDVDRWWPKDHTWWGAASTLSIDPRAGGCFCEIGRDGKQQALHMTVSFVDPGKTLRLLGGLGPLQGMGLSGAMEFRLSAAKDGGTRIVLYYRAGGYSPDDLSKFVPVIDKVQGLQLGGLADYLRKPGAAAKDAHQ